MTRCCLGTLVVGAPRLEQDHRRNGIEVFHCDACGRQLDRQRQPVEFDAYT